ncbi:type IX secretion system periplasmic lipoprotein PorW/SprE [Capnocytophaga canimorsus]|uniref:type IX secretion system periplasmic lipoprotein PorW/SprE n=1 Tax=Capnocytophaga canimorsus TaxID=28188 RepID=UPI00385D3613
MKQHTSYKVYFILPLLAFFVGCTPNANTYYNRQMQPIVTKYNVLFNGEEAFEIGKKALDEQYQDQFDEILPVEPIKMSGKIQLDGIGNEHFERAEEKAIKAIQKHSMVFKGEQRNYKIDDAYMLLGKARYYNERFFPALEAFNHLLTNYGKTEHHNEANIWAQKTNLRLGKDKIAITNLQKILSEAKLKRQDKAEAYATLGQAYINQEQYDAAANALYQAGKFTKNKSLRGRYYFVAAQLYEKQHNKDLATTAYEKVVQLNWKIPRRLWVEAQAGWARNKTFTFEEKQAFLKYLSKLEKRYEHKNYLDVLYYQHAELLQKDGNKVSAADFYRKSLKNNQQNNSLKAQAHERLAEIYFDSKDYVAAYHHFDSTLVYVPEHTFKRLFLERKRENLAKITELEFLVKQNDSVLSLVKMSQNEQRHFFEKHITSLQKEAENERKEENFQSGNGLILSTVEQKGDKFYFYNPMTVSYGKQQFQQFWGNRKLQDNWRWLSVAGKVHNDEKGTFEQEKKSENEHLTPDFFIAQLPKNPSEIVTLEQERNQALYQLGVLYKSKFNDNELAINRLERVLSENVGEDLKPATLYQLYKNHIEFTPEKAKIYEDQLLSQYPNSDYAHLLKGGETSQEAKNQQARQFLTAVTTEFENGNVIEAYNQLKNQQIGFKETTVAPQLALLSAQVQGRLKGIASYKEALETISIDFPDTEESKIAKAHLEQLTTANEEFLPHEKTKTWKLIFYGISHEDLTKAKSQLSEKIENISEKLFVSQDVYDSKETWLVVHGMQNQQTALAVLKDLDDFVKQYQLQQNNFPIASENYQQVQIQKSKEKYLTFIQSQMP